MPINFEIENLKTNFLRAGNKTEETRFLNLSLLLEYKGFMPRGFWEDQFLNGFEDCKTTICLEVDMKIPEVEQYLHQIILNDSNSRKIKLAAIRKLRNFSSDSNILFVQNCLENEDDEICFSEFLETFIQLRSKKTLDSYLIDLYFKSKEKIQFCILDKMSNFTSQKVKKFALDLLSKNELVYCQINKLIFILWNFDEAQIDEYLLNYFNNTNDRNIKSSIINAINTHHSEFAIKLLFTIFETNQYYLYKEATLGLCLNEGPEIREKLLNLLSHCNIELYKIIIPHLVLLKETKVIPHLYNIYKANLSSESQKIAYDALLNFDTKLSRQYVVEIENELTKRKQSRNYIRFNI